jgi:DnaK suppressor protein
MAAKKAASKKRAGAAASRQKAASRNSSPKKKSAGKKSKVIKKTSSPKKSPKKAASRNKPTASKKPAKKKAVATKSRPQASARGKTVSPKKAMSTKQRAAEKPAGRKNVAQKSNDRSYATLPKTGGRVATATRSRSRADVLAGPIHGIEPYVAKRGENYMSKEQLAHFAAILNSWKRELMNEVDRTVHHMQDEAANFPDPNDRATQESEFGLELRTRDRERKLLRKINSAIARIEDGTYGYCEETGEEIGLKRLEARPVATLCLEAQERREMSERQFRDRDDRYR